MTELTDDSRHSLISSYTQKLSKLCVMHKKNLEMSSKLKLKRDSIPMCSKKKNDFQIKIIDITKYLSPKNNVKFRFKINYFSQEIILNRIFTPKKYCSFI